MQWTSAHIAILMILHANMHFKLLEQDEVKVVSELAKAGFIHWNGPNGTQRMQINRQPSTGQQKRVDHLELSPTGQAKVSEFLAKLAA